ncbi:MAG TPA: efflux RND transporter periplasmic adaptor subunit [Balneolales bacterium]|nr:efflux RND transporter periplasmic adaptor subunit [Balneolales bacterium]
MIKRTIFLRIRQFGTAFLISGLLFGLSACGSKEDTSSNNQKTSTTFRSDTATVETAQVEGKSFRRSFNVTGTLVAKQRAELRTEVDGRIIHVTVDIGDHVHKGQVLLQIRQVDYKLAVEQAEANFKRAQAQYKNAKQEKQRIDGLFKAGSATAQQKDQADAAYQQASAGLMQAKAARDDAKQKLDDTTIRAPFSGYITKRNLLPGEYATVADPAFEVTDLSVLEAEMDVPEKYAGSIPLGLPVKIAFQNQFKSVDGKVTQVNPSIDTASRTFTVKIRVDNSHNSIPAGMFCTADFELPELKNQPAVPEEALDEQEGRSIVWVIKDGKAYSQEVEEGQRNGKWVMIDKGLKIGQEIAVSGKSVLINGYPVQMKRDTSGNS